VAGADVLKRAGFDPQMAQEASGYGVVTLHRPSNVDERSALSNILGILRVVSEQLPLIWPVHPRASASIERFGLTHALDGARIALLPAQGYLEMVGLMRGARLALTDSGGVQEETTALGIPCLTLRSNTERPITVEQGTNVVVGSNRARVLSAVNEIMSGRCRRGSVPSGWDGHAAERLADHFGGWLAGRQRTSLAA
jgi:UDP-N-acetylglucosamine 2-epimerase (non-hydrolysing)